ncbi:MAG TPA: hypothetical protein VH113_07760 [Gemmatimonadales bacterium]|jgi:hypothetical protein|nr:hypothetical protein [Gemmatimonadales bacterium]
MILDFDAHDAPPDHRVKEALEWIWPAAGREEFRARVLSRAMDARVRPESTLDRWARPALAAAATIALAAWVAGGLLEPANTGTLTLDGAMVSSATGSTPSAFIAAPRPPDADAMAALVTP